MDKYTVRIPIFVLTYWQGCGHLSLHPSLSFLNKLLTVFKHSTEKKESIKKVVK